MYFVFGINHKNASVDVRERYCVARKSIDAYYDKLGFLDESVVLSTCNRFEVYGYKSVKSSLESVKLRDMLFFSLNVLPSDRKFFYFLTGEDTVRHIFSVASGLDSRIFGESQIYDQVKKSYYFALGKKRTKYFLNKLFQRALFVAGKVRKNFFVSMGNVSLGSIIKKEISKNIQNPKILIIGTGDIALHVIPYLKSLSKDITVVSKSHPNRALEISKKFNLKFDVFENLEKIIKNYNVIVSSTNSPGILNDNIIKVLGTPVLETPVFIFDLGVPRNVNICFKYRNVIVYNIDDICNLSNYNLGRRRSLSILSRKFIGLEVVKFMESIKCDLMKRNIVIGSRGSNLAKRQVEEFLEKLFNKVPSLRVKFKVVYFDTTGDIDKETPIYSIEGSDFFTDVIEDKLLRGEIDIAVHSAKDLPDVHKSKLLTVALTESEDDTDCLVLNENLKGYSIYTLPSGCVIGVSSRRRMEQVKNVRPDLIIKSIRGNIEERLFKLDSGEYDGVVMATIALKRLGLEKRISQILPKDVFVPHPLQGSLAIQIREEDIKKFLFLLKLDTRKKIVFEVQNEEMEGKLIEFVNRYYWQKFIALRRGIIRKPDKVIKVPDCANIKNIDEVLVKVLGI